MKEQHQFVGRLRELEEIDQFIRSSDYTVFVLVGKAGMGKSTLVRQLDSILQQDHTVLFCHLFDMDRDQSPENLASEMNDTLTRGQFFFWGPDDRRKLKTIAAAIPTVGPLIQSLIEDGTKSQRSKLVDALKTLGKGTDHPIVLIADPFDYIENSEYENFFTALARHLPPTVKLIVPKRPADVLASSSRFQALPTVTRNKTELGLLSKDDTYKMAQSIIKDTTGTENILDILWKKSQGWPLAIYIGANGYVRTKSVALPLLTNLESLCSHLLESSQDYIRQLIYAASLVPLDLYLDDLRAVSGLSINEFALAMDNPAAKQILITHERDGSTYARLFHVLFRDYVRAHMNRLGISYQPLLERLHQNLLEGAKTLYTQMDSWGVTDRDSSALQFARRLRLYQPLLAANERTCELIRVFLGE